MSFRIWERWYVRVRQILFRKARAEGPGRPVASITNKMIVAGIGVYRGDACVVGPLGGFCGLRGAIGSRGREADVIKEDTLPNLAKQ